MYWYRDGSALSILPWLGVIALAWLGGWLMASHAFRLDRREAGRPWLDKEDLAIWPWLLVGLGLVWLFMAILDEQKNLPLISIMANGDIPPHFSQGTDIRFLYHYGFQLFSASLMQLGGLFPWSAFDAAQAILWGPTLLLAGLLLFIVADPALRWREWLRKATVVALALICGGGVVITGTQLTASYRTQLAHGFTELDAVLVAAVWGTIPADGQHFGPQSNTTILTGPLSSQIMGQPKPRNEWSRIPETGSEFFDFFISRN